MAKQCWQEDAEMMTWQKYKSNTHYLSERQPGDTRNKIEVLYDPAEVTIRQEGKHAYL